MLASEAIANLRQTELKQLSATSVVDATILGYLNEALLELYKRFNIWQDSCIVTHADGVQTYTLDGVDPNTDIDLSDKQLLVITEAWDYDGEELSLNDEDDPYGAVTPKYNIIEFPPDGVVADQDFSIVFRAAPLSMTTVGDPIDLTPVLFSAMYFYVGFRAHVSQKGAENLENDTHYKRYLGECNRVEKMGLIVAESVVPHKFAGLNYPWP
jgi:hypothetical protein